jgi:hypothetical protein
MGHAVQNIASATSNFSNNVNQIRKDPVRNVLGPMFGGAAGAMAVDTYREGTKESPAPESPGIDQGLSDIQKAQNEQYDEYKKNLPFMQNQMQERLTKQANTGIAQGQHQSEEKQSARGLGYGGLNEGMKQQIASQGQQQLAGQLSGANKGLLDMGTQIQQGGMQTGLGIQGQMQQMQNSIYQQQLARQQANNQIGGSAMGLLGSAGLMAGA